MIKKYTLIILLPSGIMSGIFLSIFFVNPYGDTAFLSEIVLQLSGSRGRLPLDFSLSGLMDFSLCLFPSFMLELYTGLWVYKHFCTASYYVFSRCPNRRKWVRRELVDLAGNIFFFYTVILATVIICSFQRHDVIVDVLGMGLSIYHVLIFSLWTYIMSILMNTIALYIGSGYAYYSIMLLQIILIVALNIIDTGIKITSTSMTNGRLLVYNPISHIVLGWHTDILYPEDLAGQLLDIDLNTSLLLLSIISLILTCIGARAIENKELIVGNIEEEV